MNLQNYARMYIWHVPIKHIFLTESQKNDFTGATFWHFLWLSICTLPHLDSSVIQYHLYASALFRCLKSIKYSLLGYTRCFLPVNFCTQR